MAGWLFIFLLSPTSTKWCWVERSLLWEITGSLAAAGNDLRVGNQLLFSKSKTIIKTNRLQPYPH